MLRIHAIGLAIVTVLAVGAIVALTASAEQHGQHLWLVGGTAVTTALKLHSLGLVSLADIRATGGEVKVHCRVFGDGYVFSRGLALVLAITAELLGTNKKVDCNFVKVGACKSGTLVLALAVNLPWLALLVLHSGQVRGLIERDPNSSVTAGAGWLIACTNILGGESVDECTNELASITVVNVTGGVESEADVINPKLNCSIGGSGAGEVDGLILTESPAERLTFH